MTFESHGKDVKTIYGYFLAPDNVDASVDDDDDDDSNDDGSNNDEFDSVDFSEDKAFSSETHVVKPKSEKLLKVRFKEHGSGIVRVIQGHFPLKDPWWSATLRVIRNHLIAICGYQLRDDSLVVKEKVLMLFLKDCKVHEGHLSAFDAFLRNTSSPGLTFENFDDQLQQFTTDNKEIAKQIQKRIEPGGHVWKAQRYRTLFRILPQLLPRHFFHITSLNKEILDDLENALSVQPWVFGFSPILTRYYNVHGCEASFKNFYQCSEIFAELSDIEKDGLLIYEALKDMCCHEGHTFVEFRSLKSWKVKRSPKDGLLKYSVSNWDKGLFFLEEKRIIVLNVHQGQSKFQATQSWRQVVKGSTRIYLSRFYFAERDIALNLEKVMFREIHSNWDVPIDFESEHFERMKTDEDQMRAAQLIAMKPVVVLSGKGGCGKTEVVGRVFGYAQKALAQERLFGKCHVTDEELVQTADEQISLFYAANDQHGLECSHQESSSTSNCVHGNGESHQISTDLHVNGREKESIETLLTTQTTVKLEEKEAVVPSLRTLSIIKCEAKESTETLLPTQTIIKHEAKDSVIPLLPTQTIIKCEAKESIETLLPIQSIIKHEANESSATTLGSAENSGSCGRNDSPESLDNSTALQNRNDTILLTAPTGKAAILLGRRSGMPGYTLHQVVYSYFMWRRNPQDHWKFSNVRVLIVDECSLVPVIIFQRALDALLKDAELCKVVLLGDVNQLPSIEPGRFLADVYEAMEDAGCSITLRTNHRSESQFIVDNAVRILQQQLPIIDPSRNFHQISLTEGRGSEDNNRDEAVRRLLRRGILHSHEKSQFVAFRRRDCDGINELCCKHYNNHSMKKHGRNGKQQMDFRPGDKVCCSRNAYVTDYTIDRPFSSQKEIPRIRLCNGEIFFIQSMHEVQDGPKTTCYVVLSDLEKEIKVDLRELKNCCKLKHAWARTIHTFQGSETDALVYVVGSAGNYQNWQHVYTAVTRGREQVHIVTQPSCMQGAIRRNPIRRNTSLKERIQAMIANQLTANQLTANQLTANQLTANQLTANQLTANQLTANQLTANQQPQGIQAVNQEESRNTDVMHSSGAKSIDETSTLSDSLLDEGPDFTTPVKTSRPQDQDVKSVSGGKRKLPNPPATLDGSPSVKCAREDALTDSLLSPLKRQLQLNNV